MSNSDSPYDIYVAGLGMVANRQITPEVDRALRRCNQTFLVHFDHLMQEYVSQTYPHVTDLSPLYRPGLPRRQTYEEMAENVLSAAESDSPVGFALYGHPLVYVHPTSLILEQAESRNLKVKVLPGISALDGLIIDLQIDPGVEGLQMYEATDMLVRERKLQPDIPCFLWQIGAVGVVTHETSGANKEGLQRLESYLVNFYPSEHKVTVARTATQPLANSRLVETPINEISEIVDHIASADTLYIPPLHE